MAARTAVSNTSTVNEYPALNPRNGPSAMILIEDQAATFLVDTPEEARELWQMINTVDCSRIGVVLAARLFGTPRVSLDWKDRCNLMKTLQRIPRLIHITFQGTTMGQVLSCDLLSRAFPSTLESLVVNAGLILDNAEGVRKLAKSVGQLPNLRELRLLNFLNHVKVTNSVQEDPSRFLDPILEALAECCPLLEKLELSCLASFDEWKEAFLSTKALITLFDNCSLLHHLELTHLNLGDMELEAIAKHRPSRLFRLVLNANENSVKGLARIVLDSCRIGSTISYLECISHVKLTEEVYDYLLWYTSLRNSACPLRHFQATLPLRLDPTLLQRQLRLQNLELVSRYYAPDISNFAASMVLSRVADDPTCLYQLLKSRPTIIDSRNIGQDDSATRIDPSKRTWIWASRCLVARNLDRARKDAVHLQIVRHAGKRLVSMKLDISVYLLRLIFVIVYLSLLIVFRR